MSEKGRKEGLSKAIQATPILLLGCTADCPDMEYLTGFRAHDPVLALRHGGGVALVVPDMELGRARLEARPGVEVFTPRMLGLGPKAGRRIGTWAVRLLRRQGIRRVYVAAAFPVGTAQWLARAGVRVVCRDEALLPERAIKRPDEQARMAESQQAAVIAMRAAIRLIAEATIDARGRLVCRGELLTSERLRRRIAAVLLEHDCFCRDTIVAGGAQGADPHQAGTGPLFAGQPIVLDIFPQHLRHGYWGDLTRTVLRGTASPELRRRYQAVKAAQAAALAAVRPGVPAATVHERAAAEFRRRGYVTSVRDGRPVGFIHGTGHGVGLAVHEEPRVSKAPGRLKAGHVITVEPGLYDPDLGGIRIEDTVVVTPGGWRHLAPCEKRFEV